VLIGNDKAFDRGVRWWQASAPRETGVEPQGEAALAKTDLGDKQVCPNCGAKFYDLRKRPAVCPKCTTSFDPSEEGTRAKRGRSRVAAHDPNYDDEELEDAKAKKGGDEDEDEAEVEETPEIDAEAEAEPLVTDDEEEEGTVAKSGDELPEGFSEDDETEIGDDADDDSVPLIEDEEELSEEELGEIAGESEDDDGNR
jgi:uncharacterized protein (TIGR02300 family)